MTRRFAIHGATLGATALFDDISVASDSGFDAIEIHGAKLESYLGAGGTLGALRGHLERARLEPLSLRVPEATSGGGGGADDQQARYTLACARAASIGCSNLVVTAPKANGSHDPDATRAATARSLRSVANLAEEAGVRVAFEFVGTPDSAVRTLAAAREIVREAGDERIGLVIDAFHFHNGASTWAMFEALDPSLIVIARLEDADKRPLDQLGDADRLLPGDGVLALRDFVRNLESTGYAGVYSIELHRSPYERWEPRRLARAARESMEAVCAEVEEAEGRLDYN